MKKIIDRRPYICYSWKNSKLNLKEGKHSIMAVFIELFLLGVGLSMDAFAVAICKGLNMRKLDKVQTLVIAFFFGGFSGTDAVCGMAAWKTV